MLCTSNPICLPEHKQQCSIPTIPLYFQDTALPSHLHCKVRCLMEMPRPDLHGSGWRLGCEEGRGFLLSSDFSV